MSARAAALIDLDGFTITRTTENLMHAARHTKDRAVSPPVRRPKLDSQAVDILALSCIMGLGDDGIARILAQTLHDRGDLSDFFQADETRLRDHYRLRSTAAQWVVRNAATARDEGSALLARMSELDISILVPGHPQYPPGVAEFFDGVPPALYVHGNVCVLGNRRVAIVNSSQPSRAGLEYTLGTARALASAGLTLLASTEGPSYNLVALAGRDLGADLVLVLNQGLFEILGKRTQDILPLARRLDHQPDFEKTLLISPFRLDGRWQKGNGRRRDTLLAAMADALVAVEVRRDGITESLCRKALSRGRPVFICPFRKPEIPMSANAELIGHGAVPLVGDAEGANADLVEKLPLVAPTSASADDLERRRALGQFFTPFEVAAFMWDMIEAFRGGKLPRRSRVAEPACGDGVFLRAALERGHAAEMLGVDLDESLIPVWQNDPVLRALPLYRTNGLVENPAIGLESGTFDVVIGNPPFSGAGLSELLRLLETNRPRQKDGQRSLFGDSPSPAKSPDVPTLPVQERAILDHLARELSRYACWRLRDRIEGDGDEPGSEPEQRSLFADVEFTRDRGVQASDYDRLAEAIRDWPADKLLDVRQSEVRNTIQRLASTAIEVFFVERFVQLAKPGGLIAAIVPESILASDQLAQLRNWLLEHGQLLAVVGLPQKLFTGAGANARTGIIFMKRHTTEEQKQLEELPRGPTARLLPSIRRSQVLMTMPPSEQKEDSLTAYLKDVLQSVHAEAKPQSSNE